MLVLDFDKTNFANLIKLITSDKKIFLLCYTNSKDSFEPANEWNLLQVFKKYVPSDDIVLAKILVDPAVNILRMFPRIDATGKELPRAVFIDGLTKIEKYAGEHKSKEYVLWLKETLENLSINEVNNEDENDEEKTVIDISI